MSSTSKLGKRCREFEGEQCKKVSGNSLWVRDEEDRLTNLPSCLISKILSCLPTNDAVRTSVLSREWKQFWKFIANLDFDNEPWYPPRSSQAKDFERFVNSVLLRHDKSCVRRFRLKGRGAHDGYLVIAWIFSVLRCNLKEFDLCVQIEYPVFLPADLFVCKTLVVLKLDARVKLKIPTSVNLPLLKTLYLAEVELLDNVSINNLLSGCPVLEELELREFINVNGGVINISVPALTSLKIVCSENKPATMRQVVINTPTLKFLTVIDFEAQSYVIKNLNNLNEALIEFGDRNEGIQSMMNPRAMTNFFNGISRVQTLILTQMSMEAISGSENVVPTFSYLTCLKLETVCHEWTYLPKLLESFPCLEILHIKENEYLCDCDRQPIDEAESPSCFLTHLKIIEIDEFRGLEYEMEMVGYFLKNANVLEKLAIYYEEFDADAIADEVLMIPRSSPICKVEFSIR